MLTVVLSYSARVIWAVLHNVGVLLCVVCVAQVPGRNPFHKCSWEKLAWFSNRPLSGWFADLLLRVKQLDGWAAALEIGRAVWLPGLFNPSAFLTAIMQVCTLSVPDVTWPGPP